MLEADLARRAPASRTIASRAALACVVLCLVAVGSLWFVTHRSPTTLWLNDSKNTGTPNAPRSIDDPRVLQLYLRATASKMDVAYIQLLPSLALFWPLASLMVVLDAENVTDRAFNASAALPPAIASRAKVAYSAPVQFSGKDRMEYDMIYADNLTQAEFVGFVDADTYFTTWVTTADVFIEGDATASAKVGLQARRPVFIAAIGRAYNGWWGLVPPSTEILLGEPAVLWCMTHFPIVVKVAHLKALRAHVERIHGVPFAEAWRRSRERNPGCQYDVMVRPVARFFSSVVVSLHAWGPAIASE